jgi:hypothetical protein
MATERMAFVTGPRLEPAQRAITFTPEEFSSVKSARRAARSQPTPGATVSSPSIVTTHLAQPASGISSVHKARPAT